MSREGRGSAVVQRLKEKEWLHHLNDRFEAVLGHIKRETKRENIVLSRTVRENQEQAKLSEEAAVVTAEEQARLDKLLKEVTALSTSLIGTKVKSAHANAAIDDELARFPPVERWDSPEVAGEDSGEKLLELANATVRKELEILKTNVALNEKEKCNSVMQLSTDRVRTEATDVAIANEKGLAEVRALEQQLKDVKAKNGETKQRVLTYEGTRSEDPVQERVWDALDKKEKQLQKDLLENLDKKATELEEAYKKETGHATTTAPRKLDLIATRVGLESDLNKFANDREELKKRAKTQRARQEELKGKLIRVNDTLNHEKIVLADLQHRNVEADHEIHLLKHDETDKELQSILQQINDVGKSNELSMAKYKKSKQLLLEALNSTDNPFSAQSLDVVLAEYERIIAAYEEQYRIKRVAFDFAPPVTYQLPSTDDGDATTPRRSSRRARHSTPNPISSQRMGEDDRSFLDTPVAHARVTFEDELSADEAPPTTTQSSKKTESRKRKPEESKAAEAEKPAPALQIVSFQPRKQQVKLANVSDRGVNLSGYRVMNCDQLLATVLPNVVLKPGEFFSIDPRPKSGPSKPADKYHAFWQEGNHGVFLAKTSGIELIAPNGEGIGRTKNPG